jgi:hypothetical protein
MTETCAAGHPQTTGNTYSDAGHPRRCAPCERARARRAWDARHVGHEVITTTTRTIDGHYTRRCLSCCGRRTYTPPEADDSAVQRAVLGDPPPHLNVSERRAAVKRLYGALPVPLIAEHVRISERTVWRHLAAVRAGAAA